MLFLRVLVRSETLTASSRIWILVADSISYNNCHAKHPHQESKRNLIKIRENMKLF